VRSLLRALRASPAHCRQSWYRLRLGQLGAGSALSEGLTVSYPKHIAIDDLVSISPGVTLRANTNAMPGISIGGASSIQEQCILSANQGRINIGSHCWLGPFCLIYGNGGVTIGNNVMIAAHTIVNTVSHNASRRDIPMSDQGIYCDPVTIEDDVWIGMHVSVLQGVVIGHGSIIGAGSVVTTDIPPWSVAVGTPARVVRQRYEAAEQP
jgi:acetyltransferase-like isoleucine patch superfamily enzyme